MSEILDKIAKVLAMAEGTDNEHEADAFLQQAQRMATRHSIDLAVARRHVAKAQQRETPTQQTIHVGSPGSMGNARFVNLFRGVAGANDIRCNIARNSTYVVAFGFPSDIEVAQAIYIHLSTQMVEAAGIYLRSGAFRDECDWDDRTGTFKPVNARAARLAFYDAFASRVTERPREARVAAETQAIDEDTDHTDDPNDADSDQGTGREMTGTALVLADKKAQVAEFYDGASNAKGRWRGAARPSVRSSSAAHAGREAGSKARLTSVATLPTGKKALDHTGASS